MLEQRFERLIQHFESAGVVSIRDFAYGTLPTPASEVEVVHQAVKALKDIKRRADFEVYLKKFLASLDIVLPNVQRLTSTEFQHGASATCWRMTKERYKDDTLDLGDAGEKVKRLINEHLISLGINPKVPAG